MESISRKIVFINPGRRTHFISFLAVLATLLVAACAKFSEHPESAPADVTPEAKITSDVKKELYPTTPENTSIDQVLQSPDGKEKLLLRSFNIKNSNAIFNPDSLKIKYTGTADFNNFRGLGKYNFDLKGSVSKGRGLLYAAVPPSGDQPKIFAVVFCNHFDTQNRPTCDSFFIDVYVKLNQFENELFDAQVTSCASGDNCLSYKKVIPSPVTSGSPPAIPAPAKPNVSENKDPSAIVENEEDDETFVPTGFSGLNQADNVEKLMSVAKGDPLPVPPVAKNKLDRANLDFPFNVAYPTEASPQQASGSRLDGKLINATELIEAPTDQPHTFYIDDNTKGLNKEKRKKTYGTFYTIDFIKKLADFTYNLFKFPLRINDISYEGGGYLDPHSWHRLGLDVDIEYANFRVKRSLSTEEKWVIFQAITSSPLVNQILVSPEVKSSVMKLAEASKDPNSKITLQKLHAECDHLTHFHINFTCAHNHCDQAELFLRSSYQRNEADTYASLEKLALACSQKTLGKK